MKPDKIGASHLPAENAADGKLPNGGYPREG
jgi:hypothetical protein